LNFDYLLSHGEWGQEDGGLFKVFFHKGDAYYLVEVGLRVQNAI
jgi:hypothetical protein